MRLRYSFSSRRTRKIEGRNDHRRHFPDVVKEVIRISDVILEVIDARFIDKTRHADIERLTKEGGKKLIAIINKTDLVDLEELKKNPKLEALYPYVLFSCRAKQGRKRLREVIKIEVKRLKMGEKRAQIGIVGYPNTGKSTIINLLTGKGAANTSAAAGFTRGIQKIRLKKGISILDTPGVIPDSENPVLNSGDAKKLAEIGVHTYDKVKMPDFVVADLMKRNPGLFEKFYSVVSDGDAEILLEEVGKKLNLIKKKGLVDSDRAARAILKDWQKGNIRV